MTNVAVFVPHRAQFGNITTQIPLLCAIRKEIEDANITIYTKAKSSQLLVCNGLADNIINYKGWNILKIVSSINSNKFDKVFNIYSGSERVHTALLLTKTKEKYAFSNSKLLNKSGLYSKHVFIQKGKQYIAKNNLGLANAVFDTNYDTTIIGMLGSDSGQKAKKSALTLVPGGGAGAFKVWPIEKYCEAAKEIYAQSEKIDKINIIIGPQESPKATLVENLLQGIPYEIKHSPSISELVDIANESALTLSNDCGPCHIFQMMKVPMVMIWGWEFCKFSAKAPYFVMPEWYHSTSHSWCVFPDEENKSIQSISVERVSSLALMELNRQTQLPEIA
ncbi:lipopolysaccharide heptosyltransferase family protein [Vibrio natriegens]|uniref:glycosyltransferase family 9 protein n=1 Tax=Vibrio natriegens TaxID=691 RepID=UPI0021E93AEF|nr:glycosyltransferase family 9 protein [Vibrio natriegens]UYI47281.1 lipopolysaccharide heptosyltransferase family protein [Vibrio natriegens]